jgi:HD superfamily phosphohydrolase
MANEIPELNHFAERTIQTSSLSPTPFTLRLSHIISHPLMRRLAGVSQLGFISLVYPTATHSRFEHVLGTPLRATHYTHA